MRIIFLGGNLHRDSCASDLLGHSRLLLYLVRVDGLRYDLWYGRSFDHVVMSMD